MTERIRNIIAQGSIPEFENDGDDLDRLYLPVRGVQVALGKENPLVVLPDSDGIRDFVSQSEAILTDLDIQCPETLLVPDSDYFLDLAIRSSIEMLADRLDDKDKNIVWQYANTGVSDEWVEELGNRGYRVERALPRKEYKDHQTRSAWGRRISEPGNLSFPERHGLPYPVSYIANGLSELEEAYQRVVRESGRNATYLKMSASAGGFGVERVDSQDKVKEYYARVLQSGLLNLFNDGSEQDIEVQAEIENIVGFGSLQYLGNDLQTPGGVSVQILDGNNWVGNKFNILSGSLKEKARAVFKRFSVGMMAEHPEDFRGWGGLDIGFQLRDEEIELMVVENNWGRITGAHPGIYFANAIGVSDRPFLVQKLKPPKVDAKECWEMLKKEKMALDRQNGRGAIPFPWVENVDAFIFVAGESEKEIMEIAERTMSLTVRNGYH